MTRLLTLPLLLLGFAASAQTATSTNENPLIGLGKPATEGAAPLVTYRNNRIPDPLYVVDGQIIDAVYLLNISPDQIKSVEVIKDKEAIGRYGEKGRNGVILLTTTLSKTNCE